MKLSFVGKMRAKKEVTVLRLSGLLDGNTPGFMFLGLSVADALNTMEAVEQGKNIDLTGKATILMEGEGYEPSDELREELFEAYGIHELSNEEFQQELQPYLPKEDE